MIYEVQVWLPDGEVEKVYISEELFHEEKLDRGVNLERYISDCIYGGQLVNVGYPILVEDKEIV